MPVLVTNVCEYTGPGVVPALLRDHAVVFCHDRSFANDAARHLQPEPGFAVATSIRAATTAFAQALAREAAPHQVQVNVVEPNYLYSEAYYPRATFLDTEEGRARIAARVPMGRLGAPEEVGELIAFLMSGRSTFVTGQVIGFTGGWP